MVQNTEERLPPVRIYAIGPEEAERAAPLLTAEAQSLIKKREAFGLALAEEGELRAAVCARLQPENEAILELLSLYVAPRYRRRALGGTLLLELLEEMMAATDAGLRAVTAVFTKGTQGAEELLSRMGFLIEEDETAYTRRLTVGELAASPLMAGSAAPPAGYALRCLQELTDGHIRRLVQTLKKHGVDDLSAAGLRQAHPRASHVLYDRDGLPAACAIFSGAGEDRVVLTQFFSALPRSAPTLAVLRAAARVLTESLPDDARVDIPVLTASSARLAERLVPAGQRLPLMRAVLPL